MNSKSVKKSTNAKFQETFVVLENLIGHAIGRNGANLEKAREHAGVRFMKKTPSGDQTFQVFGDSEQKVKKARSILECCEESNVQKNTGAIYKRPRKKTNLDTKSVVTSVTDDDQIKSKGAVKKDRHMLENNREKGHVPEEVTGTTIRKQETHSDNIQVETLVDTTTNDDVDGGKDSVKKDGSILENCRDTKHVPVEGIGTTIRKQETHSDNIQVETLVDTTTNDDVDDSKDPVQNDRAISENCSDIIHVPVEATGTTIGRQDTPTDNINENTLVDTTTNDDVENQFKLCETFAVPWELAGIAIGTHGTNINKARQYAEISCKESKTAGYRFKVQGKSKEAVKRARQLLELRSETYEIPKEHAGRMIGRYGVNMDDIVRRSGINRITLTDTENLVSFNIIGSLEGIKIAKILLQRQMDAILVQEQRVHIRIYRRRHQSFGFSLAGGKGSVPYREDDEGLYVCKVEEGRNASRAGLQVGDKLLSINGTGIEHSYRSVVTDFILSSTKIYLIVYRGDNKNLQEERSFCHQISTSEDNLRSKEDTEREDMKDEHASSCENSDVKFTTNQENTISDILLQIGDQRFSKNNNEVKIPSGYYYHKRGSNFNNFKFKEKIIEKTENTSENKRLNSKIKMNATKDFNYDLKKLVDQSPVETARCESKSERTDIALPKDYAQSYNCEDDIFEQYILNQMENWSENISTEAEFTDPYLNENMFSPNQRKIRSISEEYMKKLHC